MVVAVSGLQNNMNNNCSIIVSSFDGYSSAWHPFFTLFFRYWDDCPLPIYLISNNLKYKDKRVQAINIPNDKGWSGNLIYALNEIKSDYIIYLQEDYFLTEKINTKKILKMINIIKKENAGYLRLSKKAEGIEYKDYNNIEEIPKNAGYLNSTQASIWNKEMLLSILKEGESGWDFELKGGIKRARSLKAPFLATKTDLLPYFKTAIVKGRYLYDAIKLCENEGIEVDTSKIKAETWLQYKLRKSYLHKKLKSIYSKYKK